MQPARNTQMNSMGSHDHSWHIYAFQLWSLIFHCWLNGFLDCSLCCFTPLFWPELWKSLSGILEVIWRYPSLRIPRLAPVACNQAAYSNAYTKDGRWHTVLSMLVSICVGINKQSLYAFAFMLKVKVFNTLGDYRLLHHHFTQCVWPDYWSWMLPPFSSLLYSDIIYQINVSHYKFMFLYK